MANRAHARYLINTLAPDLKASGRTFTSRDVAKCGRLMLRGKKDVEYASWLNRVLIPDLRESGATATADDLAVCSRAIGARARRRR